MLKRLFNLFFGQKRVVQGNDPFDVYFRVQKQGERILRSVDDPRDLNKIEEQIRTELNLHYQWSPDGLDIVKAARNDLRAIQNVPGLPFVFMFHGDGRIRQEALRNLEGPLPTPANVYGLFWRLNDWVPQVRQAAYEALERVMPRTSAEVIVPALIAVLPNLNSWGRWSCAGPEAVHGILSRPDVSTKLVEIVRTTRQPRLGQVFHELSRNDWIDQHISDVFATAPLPHIRTMALDMLLSQRARWPTGETVRVWTDRSMGEYRTERSFRERELTVAVDLIALLRAGASDRSAMVRRRAADGLIALRHNLDLKEELDRVAAILHNDPNIGVRTRIEFFRRKQAEV
ncbi:hypothetical protein [Chachezhania sediminis]|uniref:hypothetical protein n=1 Tax=Chachezhania sediminis TaxID=2599291 RepID=UPI00131B4E0B|nr:hypothetical protein [Chachezhania sediminis]